MPDVTLNRSRIALIAIGLVLVGLLMGVLAMQAVLYERGESARLPAQAVELGEPASARLPAPVAAPEVPENSDLAGVLTLNRVFREAAERVTAAVVFIEVEVKAEGGREWFHNFGGGMRQSVGSGVILSDDGYIATNHHVVEGASAIRVTLDDKREYVAEVVGTDPSTDLAVIKIEPDADLPGIPFADSDAVEVGDWVLAVGNPFRLTSTVTAGIVSATGRQVNIIEAALAIEDFIQTDAAINPGNSGGALVNVRGELVGINTAIATEGGSYEGYGFAVPTNLMRRIAEDLIAFGIVRRGLLGVRYVPVDDERARRLQLDRVAGVYVAEVPEGGAADRAGIRPGDVIRAIDSRVIGGSSDLQSTIARYRPGDTIVLDVWRRGVARAISVQLLGTDDPAYSSWLAEAEPRSRTPERPPVNPEVEPVEIEGYGLGLQPLSRSDRSVFDIEEGVYVAYVEQGQPAALAGVPRDVVLTAIAGQPVASVDDAVALFEQVAEAEDAVLLRVRRRTGLSSFYEIEVARR